MQTASARICIVGIWHQGAVAAACLADLGYSVVGVDLDQSRINGLNQGKAPLYEPGLDELLTKGINSGHLKFTNSLKEGLSDTNNILFMFDTSVDENDDVDLTEIFDVAREMAPYLLPDSLLLVTAQIPVGTCDQIREIILDTNPKSNVKISYWPENLRLGQAVDRFMHPPLPVIGADDEKTFARTELLLSPLASSWMRVNLRTAEMTKHALNAFLAVSICFANELGNLCDGLGADGVQVAKALRIEPRIGSKAMLFPGLGFSGGTLARDMKALKSFGIQLDIDTPLLNGAWESNQQQNQIVVKNLKNILGNLKGQKVSIFGLTYKPDTSTLRRSASIEIINNLVTEGALVSAYDPMADKIELSKYSGFTVCADPYSALIDSNVFVLVTPWPDFKNLDYTRIYSIMKRPVIFDTQNALDKDLLTAMGYSYFGIGRGTPMLKKVVKK